LLLRGDLQPARRRRRRRLQAAPARVRPAPPVALGMKALFFSVYPDTPHFETELELISDLVDTGAKVHVLRCTGQLATCLTNPAHKSWQCRTCVSKIDAGLHAIGRGRVHVEELPPASAAGGSELPHEFASVDELKGYEYDGANLGRGVYS